MNRLLDKYRPKKFEDVVGQRAVDIVRSCVRDRQTVPGLWIFYGPKGVGKTTTARILGMALNCKETKNNEPCLVCESCKETERGVGNIIEIDGASNRGIDEIRNLKKIVGIKTRGTRVIIIDEAHMLTEYAFNALLKLTEEPPDHTIFVLVSTRLGMILETIRDRAVLVEFARVKETILVQHIRNLAKKEGFEEELSTEVLDRIIGSAEGSVRSVVKGLDVFLSFARDNKVKEFVSSYSISDTSVLEIELVKSFIARRIAKFADSVNKLAEEGKTPIEILIIIYSGVLTVMLREKGLTKFKDSDVYADVSVHTNQVSWFVNRFPTYLQMMREFPDYSLLTKMLLESICMV